MAVISRCLCVALLLSQAFAQEACAAQDPLCKDAEPGMAYLLQKDKATQKDKAIAIKDESAHAKDESAKAKAQEQQEEHSVQEQQDQMAEQVQEQKKEQAVQMEGEASEVEADQTLSQASKENKSAWGFGPSPPPPSVPTGCPGATLAGSIFGGFLGSGNDPACCYGNIFQSAGSMIGLNGGPCTNPSKMFGGEGENCPLGAICTATPYIPGMGKPTWGYCRCQVGQCSTDGQSCQSTSR
eukprot:TRINITY_DN2794_c0_g1_i1.p1 TRINITY_DN2794_c0_g1~~TRINITY_DN2794_c0_g1_i1.p1  ORF type:complete len:256 (+),score=41.84 TRINITY_DN2794_c0_g1_i1:50-769(+)